MVFNMWTVYFFSVQWNFSDSERNYVSSKLQQTKGLGVTCKDYWNGIGFSKPEFPGISEQTKLSDLTNEASMEMNKPPVVKNVIFIAIN